LRLAPDLKGDRSVPQCMAEAKRMGQAPSQRDGLGTELHCLLGETQKRHVDRPGAVSARARIMATEGEREGMTERVNDSETVAFCI
jgi:hypothetical protein